MSIFFPLRSQYEALQKAFREVPVIRRQAAAQKMSVASRRVTGRVEKMIRKGYYKEETPYYDPDLDALVAGPRYQVFAKVYIGAENLKKELIRVQRLITKRINGRYSMAQKARPAVVGRFLEDLSGGMRGGNIRSVLASKGKKFVKNLIDPGSTFEDDPVENALMEVLGLIENDCTTLLQVMRAQPLRNYTPFLTILITVSHRIKAVEQCLPEGDAADRIALSSVPSAGLLARQLREENLAQFDTALKNLLKPDQKPLSAIDALIAQLGSEAHQLRTLSGQITRPVMKESLLVIAGKLEKIQAQLLASPAEVPSALTRSLTNVYLPMMDQLLSRYMSTPYTRSAESTFAATEDVFAATLPQAFDRILADISSNNAMGMQASAEALVKKMQIDGLLPMDFGSKPQG